MPRSENAWGRKNEPINEFRWTNNLGYEDGYRDGLTLTRLGNPEEVQEARRQHTNLNKPYCQGFIDGLDEGLNH